MKVQVLIIVFLLASAGMFNAQTSTDTLQNWMSTFYKISNVEMSPDGKWAAVKMKFDTNQDTTLVYSTQKENALIVKMDISGKVTFFEDNGMLLFGKGKAVFRNLRTGKSVNHEKVKMAIPLPQSGHYAIYDQNDIVSVYTTDGIKKHQITDVKEFPITDNKKVLYINKATANHNEITKISSGTAVTLYSTSNPIKKMLLPPSGKHLFIVESNRNTDKLIITTIDVLHKTTQKIAANLSNERELIVSEIQNGKAYLMNFQKTIRHNTKPVVDIWYGNDSYLEEKRYGERKSDYLLWNAESGKITAIPNDKYSHIASLNNSRYFLAFNPYKGHNYITRDPQFTMQVYDGEKKQFNLLGSLKGMIYGSPEVVYSPDGRYLLVSTDGEKWTIVEGESMERSIIDKVDLQNPAFSSNSKYILFESSDDLWRYDIEGKKLQSFAIAAGRSTKMLNNTKIKNNEPFNFFIDYIDVDQPVLIEATNKAENKTSVITWKKGKSKQIISETPNNIELAADKDFKQFCIIEEHYNLPTRLFFVGNKERAKPVILHEGNLKDKKAFSLKQEVIHYKNTEGKALKGLLFYPAEYNSSKKYPMIVNIYQIQSNTSNEYQVPGYNSPPAFDLRTLVERGYFVFLPDIVFGKSGTGVSALDCVSKALDAVSNNQSIDKNRIGLTGHSHGGYETNFIATHSNRFAAYLSGAGNSDIVRSYFSYNYNFKSPFYWQYENGQYEINIPFSENKELYFKNNPIYNVENVNAPILLWAGRKDENIAWDQTMEFYIGLKRNNKQVIALFYPEGSHGLRGNSEEQMDIYRRTLEWWDYFLKDKRNVPWINKQIKGGAG